MSAKGSKSLLQFGAGALRDFVKSPRAQHRTFTQSSQRRRYGPVVKFTNLSSPELDTLLTTLREKVIMPTHLTSLQRNLIFREKHRKQLLLDPLVANLDGEDFTLRPIDRTKDLPNLRRSLFEALDLMKTKGDWDNLPLLLRGLRQARLNLNSRVFNKVIRKASAAGRQDVILECTRQAEETGFNPNDFEVSRQILWWFQKMAVDSDFDRETTKKALAWSEHLFELMELPKHQTKDATADTKDPRTEPHTVGILLELAAVRAFKHQGGKDVDGKVKEYTTRLVATSKDIGTPTANDPARFWLMKTVPILYGMKTAIRVLGSNTEIAGSLQAITTQFEEVVNRYQKELEEDPSMADKPSLIEVYDKSFDGML